MRSSIVNYWRSPTRDSPVNIAIVRVLLGLFVIWKTLSTDWAALQGWPFVTRPHYNYILSDTSFQLLPTEAWVVAFITVLFILGYRLRLTSFLLALGIAHLTLHRWVISSHGDTAAFFIMMYFVVLYGLFAETDVVSLDGIRRTKNLSLEELNSHLQSANRGAYSMAILKWSMFVVALLYFGSGFGKLVPGPLLEWVQADTISRFITHREVIDGMERPVGQFIASQPLLSFLSAGGTIVLELGLLIAILLGLPLLPIVVGLIGAHIVIAFALGPFFFDQIFLLLLFAAWDVQLPHLIRGEELDIVYDEHCYFCARSLYLFQFLDLTDSITFYSQYSAPHEYKRMDGVEFEDSMYAFDGENTYEGYYAFQRLFGQFHFFYPVAAVFGLPGVRDVGERIYRYIADNRDRYFACAVDTAE